MHRHNVLGGRRGDAPQRPGDPRDPEDDNQHRSRRREREVRAAGGRIFHAANPDTLSGALNGADVLDKFLKVTDTPLIKFAEGGIVVALALHMALGLRVLAIEMNVTYLRSG